MRLTGWRKIATAMWGPPNDPTIHGALDFDAAPLTAFLERERAAGHRVTYTHLVGRAAALAMAAAPEINVRIRGGTIEPRGSVDVFFIATVEGGGGLSGIKVREVDRKSAREVAAELARRAAPVKTGTDPEFAREKKMLDRMPPALLRTSMRFAAWMGGDLGRDLKPLGIRASHFGGVMVSNVGQMGLPQGLQPLAHYFRMPFGLLVGSVTDKVVPVKGKPVVRPTLPVTAAIDHRYADGSHIARLFERFTAYMADPAAFEPTSEPAPDHAPAPQAAAASPT